MGSHVTTTPEHASTLVNITVTTQSVSMEKLVMLSLVCLVITVSAFSPGIFHKHSHSHSHPYRRGSYGYNRSPSVFQTFKHGLNSLLFGPIKFKIISNRPNEPPEESDGDEGCDGDDDCRNGRTCNGRRCVFG